MSPVFAKDIHRVSSANNVIELGDTSSNGFASVVVGEGIVALVQFRVRSRSGVDDKFVISKHKRWDIDGNSQVA